jgi:hypothetical protein
VDPRIRRENDSDKKNIYNKTRINLEQNHDNWLELTYGLISIAKAIPFSIMALALVRKPHPFIYAVIVDTFIY